MKTTKAKHLLIQLHASYVFMRENHAWHGCEVTVIGVKRDGFTVARSCRLAEALLSPRGHAKRTLKTWTAKSSELW